MASAASLQSNPRSAGREMESTDFDGSITFGEATVVISSLKMTTEERPVITNKPPGHLQVSDLQLRLVVSGSRLAQFCDVVRSHKELGQERMQAMDFEKNMMAGTYSSLPEPLRLKKEPPVPYTMLVIPIASGDFTVLKHIMLQPNTLQVPFVLEICCGQAMQFHYRSNVRSGCMGMHLMFQHLRGLQARYNFLLPKHQRRPKDIHTRKSDV